MANYVWLSGPVKVSTEDCYPSVDPDPIVVNTHGNQPTMIHWQGDGTVDEITSIVIHDPDGDGEFTQPEQLGPKTWRVIDSCLNDKQYKYDITVKGKNCEEAIELDPIINNQDGGPH